MYQPKCSHTWINCLDCIWFWSIKRFTECNKATPSWYLIAELRKTNISKQIILIQYGTTWILTVSAIPFSYTEIHVLQNNANKWFPVLSKVTTAYTNIESLLVETLFNKLLKCFILTFRETPKARRLILSIALKFHRRNRSTVADSPVKLRSNRGIFIINIAASILQESWCQLSPNRYRSAGRNGKKAPGPILRIGHSGNTQHENTETQKSAPPSGDRSATAPHKWKRTLKGPLSRTPLPNYTKKQ